MSKLSIPKGWDPHSCAAEDLTFSVLLRHVDWYKHPETKGPEVTYIGAKPLV
jgi:hypothetical protein